MKIGMKKYFLQLLLSSSFVSIIAFSCKKSGEGKHEHPPIAVAGTDKFITLPTDSVFLDGSGSRDLDGAITEWLWKKISGPASFTINHKSSPGTVVRNLVVGIYRFQLQVTDDEGLSSKDTLTIVVDT